MERIETNSAVVERINPDLVICTYKPGVKVDADAVRENLLARKQFPGREAYVVIGIFPEDVDFDMSLLDTDHYKATSVDDVTRLLAIVAEGSLFERIAQLYFAYHPTNFTSRVFRRVADAMNWADERILERDRA